jgi:hypothetical protein
MFDSTALEVVIGLVFIYLIFSIFCSAINEWVARLIDLRAKTLRTGIKELLQDGAAGQLADALYAHPLIKGLQMRKWKVPGRGSVGPSYIPARTFAQALFDEAVNVTAGGASAKTSGLSTEAQKLVNAVIAGAGANVTLIQDRLEKWFDDSMERVSGIYKRRTQGIIVVIAAVVAFAFNVDTIRIARRLHGDPVLRAAMVKRADAFVRRDSAVVDSLRKVGLSGDSLERARVRASQAVSRAYVDTLQTELPLGWEKCKSGGWKVWQCNPLSGLNVLGLLLTIIALSLGAPFWFDTLNKLANLRQTGVPPDERKAREVPK